MTREEAIFILKRDNPNNIAIRTGFESLYDQRKEGFSMAIKALEEESILDKVRAEMFEEMLSHSGTGEEVIQAYVDGLKKGLDILDKYKGESEPKDGGNELTELTNPFGDSRFGG